MPISAQMIRNSIHPQNGKQIFTLALIYPRFIHSEFMTHRVFTKNAASSRAIPIEKMIARIEADPAMPFRWGHNGKGMQDHGKLSPEGEAAAKAVWLDACADALKHARRMVALNEPPHKQIVNRLTEPFVHMETLVTSTEWDNWFELRDHCDADPTIEALAKAIRHSMLDSQVQPLIQGWHLPFITPEDEASLGLAELLMASTARCSRVSYTNHGLKPEWAKDEEQYVRLVGSKPIHASPTEHQAMPDVVVKGTDHYLMPSLHGNFSGWIQHRKVIETKLPILHLTELSKANG